MAGSEAAAASIISSLASYKLFRLKSRTSGADAGLALLMGKGTGKDKIRRDNLEFVPYQLASESGDFTSPTRSRGTHVSSKTCIDVPECVGLTSEKNLVVQSSKFEDEERLCDSKDLFKPFQFGWMRECIILPGENGVGDGSVVEVIYVSPHSRKLKQRVRLKTLESVLVLMSQYFPDMDLKPCNFSFEKKVLGLGWDQEILKQKVGGRYKIQCPVCFRLIFNNLNYHMNIHRDIKPTLSEPSISVKSDEASACPICQPDILKAHRKKVSSRHLTMHKYIPTVSRKELSKCYVVCSRVDQVDDGEPRQVCVHCGLSFTYLDGAWKRHVRRCLKLTKQSELPNLINDIKSEPLQNSDYLSKEATLKFVSSQTCPYYQKQSTGIVSAKEDPDGPSALARATCASLASEIHRSWTRDKAAPCLDQPINTKVVFTMRCLDSLVSSNKSRVFSVSIKPKVLMEKGMAAFGRQFGLDHRKLEFKCKGQVISADMKASEVGGSTVWVRKL